MFKEDKGGRFIDKGIFRLWYVFHTGKSYATGGYNKQEFASLRLRQKQFPVSIMKDSETGKRWWMFQGKFFVEDEDYTAEEIKALILSKQVQKNKRIKRAMVLMEKSGIIEEHRRDSISDEVKMFVWQRDGGKCVKCGSQENLEFDHIIPVSKGGANSERNIQILCEKCNREKHDNIS